MTQEEKQLLLADLCARLPYGTRIRISHPTGGAELDDWLTTGTIDNISFFGDIKPYLRPMSSMTDEEKVEIQGLYHQNTQEVFKDPSEIRGYRFYDISVVDWLNAHHFDYRGLIEKGLALEAPEDMYK